MPEFDLEESVGVKLMHDNFCIENTLRLELDHQMHKLDRLLRANNFLVGVGDHPILTKANIEIFVERTWLAPIAGKYTHGKGMGTYYPEEMHLLKIINHKPMMKTDLLAAIDKSILGIAQPPTLVYKYFVDENILIEDGYFCRINKDKFKFL